LTYISKCKTLFPNISTYPLKSIPHPSLSPLYPKYLQKIHLAISNTHDSISYWSKTPRTHPTKKSNLLTLSYHFSFSPLLLIPVLNA
jgi:hypothetical protein